MRRRIMSRAAGASAVVLAAALVATGTSSGAASGKTPPDGRIAYSDGGAGRVATANPNGSAIRFVTPDGEFSFQAAWSPDSSHLVYSSDRTTGNDLRIFTVRRDGTGVH